MLYLRWIKLFRFSRGILIAAIVAVLLRACVLETFKVSGDKMSPALISDDIVIGLKVAYGWRVPGSGSILWQWNTPKRGDVVIVSGVDNPTSIMVRRVMGVPGDSLHIDFRPAETMLWLNGQKLPCIFNKNDAEHCEEVFDTKHVVIHMPRDKKEAHNMDNPLQLKENQYYVLADDRREGPDSRDFGPITLASILGKVTYVVVPSLRVVH